jgi:UDP-N-acetylmuramate dehydrogenase
VARRGRSRLIAPVRVAENAPLAPRTTLRVGGPAKRLAVAEREEAIVEAVRDADAAGEPLLVLGGGSNLLVADAGWDGTVLVMASRGVAIREEGGAVLVTAAAGEPWDELVAFAVAEGLSGVECLAGIPGLVGAVPMQNVGAYGQDVSETIVSVRAYDREERRVVEIAREACDFSYRNSVFRGKSRHVILSVTFALERRAESRPVRYAELARHLGVDEGARAPLRTVRDVVVALRKKKGMVLDAGDPDTASAGSFFTNPILDAAALGALSARVAPLLREGERMPLFPDASGRTKVSAAWLIERAGFTKGFSLGRAAISSKHALALTNRGGATASEILTLARAVRDGVRDRFGVVLENEPVLVGATL